MTFLRRFVAFWYDFLVGDRWELFLGPLAALLIVGVAVAAGVSAGVAGVVLVLLVLGIAGFSLAVAVRG
jgi:hypothetical protein